MNPEEIRKHLASLRDEQRAMLAAIKAEGREAFTAEEETKYDALEERAGATKRQLDRVEALEAAEKELGRPTTTAVLEPPVLSSRAPITSQIPRGQGDRPLTLADQGFRSMGEFLYAVSRAGDKPGSHVDPRLLRIQQFEAAALGSNESTPSDGGYLVGIDQSDVFLQRIYDASAIAGRTTPIEISSGANATRLNGIDERSRVTGSRWGGVQAYWVDEATAPTASRPKFRRIELILKKLMCLYYATDEELMDAAQLQRVADQAFPDEMAYMLDDALIRGTGAGQPLGVLNAPATVSVAKRTGQAAATVLYENILDMWSRGWGRSRPNMVWLINQDVEPALYTMSLAVGTGGAPAFLPPGGISGQPYATLFGRPVMPIEQCATLGTVGDIILADWSQYLLARKGGILANSSIHVQFITDEMAFRWVMRVDGQPTWHVALTPATNSSNTLSPFVTLATRS
jgi:HK97 family phage major capsid protein